MKQLRPFALLVGLVLSGLLAFGCGAASGSRGWAPPVRAGDLLLVSTGRGRLDGLDAGTYSGRWRFPNSWALPGGAGRLAGIYGPPVLSSDGSIVYVGDYNGYVYAFRPDDFPMPAEQKPKAASLKLNDSIIGGIALDTSTDTLFVTAGKSLYTIRAADLVGRIGDDKASVTLSRVFKTGGEIWSVPVLKDGKVFVSSLDGNLYALNSRTGRELWRFRGGKGLASTPAVAGDLLLVGGFDSRLHAVDLATGSEKWSFAASNWVWSRPLVVGERVYFGDFAGRLYALNLASGAAIWDIDLNKGAIRASPALAAGLVIVATEEGWLVAVDPSSQATRWEKKLDASLNADLVVDGDKVLIAPSRCETPAGAAEKVYYASIDPLTGELRSAGGVC